MYKKIKANKTSISVNQEYYGETIEAKIRRIVNNKEPIKDGAPLIYTERKDGVIPDYDIRTDRWEHAVEAMSKIDKANKARRADTMGEKAKEGMEAEAKTEGPSNASEGKA